MSSRQLPRERGQPRPVSLAWLYTPQEIAAMLARPHFLRFRVERRSRRLAKQRKTARVIATASH